MSNTAMLRRGLTPTHELMGQWILQNPGGTLREMSQFFGYSPSWLSQVINSDMFKAYVAGLMQGIEAHVMQDVPMMLRGTAVLAIERMNEVLQKTEDADTIVDAFDKVLHRHGYAPSKAGVNGAQINQQNVFFLNKDELAGVKRDLISAHVPAMLDAPVLVVVEPEKVVDGDLMPAT